MRQIPAIIEDMLKPVVTGLGYEWVGAEFRGGTNGLLRIYIDSPNGVNVDDCGRVSDAVSGILDVEDPFPGRYVLEVSSPGLDRPLFKLADFERFKGRVARIRMSRPINRQKKFQGVIESVTDGVITLKTNTDAVQLPFVDIDRANLVFDFDLHKVSGT
ncbi:MAG TPA: ribosome maturation factor RimP [Halothiobacillus sp.]|nr:ribosome maturation factor RimP [Halothiobacillus sp.]